MSLTASAPRLSRTSRWTAHRTSRAQTHRTLSSAPTPTVGAIGGTLRRPLVPPASSAHLPAGGARGFQGWEGGRGKPIIVRAAPATDAPASDDAPPMVRGKKPARGGTRADPAAAAAAANPSVAAASGPPVDILADDALGPDHARVRRWVVFSDLHLNRRTSRVCVDVLEAVHREAVARDAGIAFLGDFWHARGAIPVEPLIDALDAIRSWTRPCVMIPGNHDQVTAGGEVHALTPLATANPSRVKIISKPTVWRNALWLPYRRDASVVKNAVEAAWSVDAEDGRPVRAVFCHADVIGASMNESFQARDGLDPSLLEGPAAAGATAGYRIPVYTGHYHKPHTVPNTNITYVGSPYQVSRAEAGQAKALVVLDAEEGWLGCERANPTAPADADPVTDPVTGVSPRARLPLDLGPRHYAVTGEDGDVPEGARAGDVIRWTLPLRSSTTKPDGTDKTGPDDETNPASKPPTQIERARAAGIAVEIAYETTTSPPRIPKAESLGPSGLYAAYAKAVDLPADVVELGKSVLEEVAANVAAADVDGTSARSIGGGGGKVSSPVQLSMRSVEVEGYGAFTDAVTYPLRDRGVCAVVGDNRDDGCSDSNGAGKTTLVMAAMWALTGNSDIRVEGGAGKTLTKTDVVNDYAKTARVRLEGAANGVPFWVERRVSRSKLLGLRYGVGDDERTLADSRLTQAAMDADLGASVAARIAFHGQHTVGQLLDANDAALKAALGELVDADTWQEAKDLSRKRVGEARKRAAALGADASARADYVRRIEQRLAAATAASEDWTAQVERNVSRLAREEEVAADALGAALGAVVVAADALRAASARWDAEEAEAAAEADAAAAFLDPRVDEETDPRATSSFEVDEAAIASEAAALEEDAERARGYARELQGAEAAARAVAAQAHRAVGQYAGDSGARFEDVVGEEGASEAHEHRSAGDAPVCATCLQPIDLTHRAHVLDRLKRDAETTRGEHQRLLASLRAAEAEAAATEKKRRDAAAAANRARADASARAAAAANRARDAQARLRAVRDARVNAHVVAAAMARAEALVAASPVAPASIPSDANTSSGGVTTRSHPGHSPAAARRADSGDNAPALALVTAVETAVSEAERAFRTLETRSRDRAAAAASATANPHDREVASLQSQADVEAAELEARREEAAVAEAALATVQRADSAFGTRGIQSYLFEGALGELSARVGEYMDALTGGALAMELRPAAVGEPHGGSTRRRRRGRTARGAGGADAEDEDGGDERAPPSVAAAEKIEKVIFAQSHDGERVQRSLRQLSGGERRRAALALALAHADLASARSGVGCDLLVLDEVLQHLDGEGIARVGALLRSLPKGTVLLTSQADSATSHLFDVVDRVFKKNGASGVATGCDAAFGTDEDEVEVAAEFS